MLAWSNVHSSLYYSSRQAKLYGTLQPIELLEIWLIVKRILFQIEFKKGLGKYLLYFEDIQLKIYKVAILSIFLVRMCTASSNNGFFHIKIHGMKITCILINHKNGKENNSFLHVCNKSDISDMIV